MYKCKHGLTLYYNSLKSEGFDEKYLQGDENIYSLC